MSLGSGTSRLGPENATLTVHTTKAGAAARAGHNLRIEVGRWSGTVSADDGAPAEISLSADSRSFRVLEGTGGIKPLTDEDRANIAQTIDDEVLKGCPIEFRSTRVTPDGDAVHVDGELELAGQRRPVTFTLTLGGDGRISGEARVTQTDFGMKPYSALFGTLKVGDEVTVAVDGTLADR